MNSKILIFGILALGALSTVSTTQGHAQPLGGPSTRPAISPYLNLLRPGGVSVQNYFGLVRPQQQARTALNNLQQQVGTLNKSVNLLESGNQVGAGVSTGHAFGYMTHGQYFMNMGGGAGAGGRGGMGMQAGGGANMNRNVGQQASIGPRRQR